jgi:3-oxoacyl-(acyl-carrier-protein) synthase
MSTRRVAVTGLGVICALGNDTSETWNAVCEGRSGIAPISVRRPSLPVRPQKLHGFTGRNDRKLRKWNLLFPTRLLSGVSTPFWRSAGRTIKQARQLNSQPRAG